MSKTLWPKALNEAFDVTGKDHHESIMSVIMTNQTFNTVSYHFNLPMLHSKKQNIDLL